MSLWTRLTSSSVTIPTWLFVALFAMSLAGLVVGGTALVLWSRAPSVAYVRSSEVVQSYKGMKAVRRHIGSKKETQRSRLDSLRQVVQKTKEGFSANSDSLSQREVARRRKQFRERRAALQRQKKRLQNSLQKTRSRLVEGALNQINSFAETYAKNHGYTLILGTTQSGNLLYGSPAHDVTDDLLQELNDSYGGEATSAN